MKKTLFLSLMVLAAVMLQAQTGREIMEKCETANTADNSRALVLMTLIDKDGSTGSRQVEQINLENNGDSNTLILFHSPANVRDTRFLSITHEKGNKDQWIFLPALKKVRRIASSEGDSSFMGTDFSYEDIGGRDIDEFKYENKGEESIGEYACWIVESTPADSADSQYSKIMSWIDKTSLLVMKQTFYDNSGTLTKTLDTRKIARVQGIWTRLHFAMTNHKNGHSTELEIKKLVYNSEINNRVFSTNFLKSGRL